MKILSVMGTRPNFMKLAPLHRAMSHYPDIQSILVHTGQHYDRQMSEVFFEQLSLPKPDYFLGVNGGSHTKQTASIMLALEEVVQKEKPDLILVVGDVNSTLAGALVAVKSGIRLAHVEAGLRSGDRAMPEEQNRILTDSVSDYLFVTEKAALVNLEKEGIPKEKVFFTGNCMIDSLVYFIKKAEQLDILKSLGLSPKNYVLMTMHRPSNVDNREGLEKILSMVELISDKLRVVFPLHPRTRSKLQEVGLLEKLSGLKQVILLEPQGYLEFQNLVMNASAVLTDSGGIQEESTYLNVPCLTFRENTERPVTIESGSNELIPDLNPELACQKIVAILQGKWKNSKIPELWDGKAADRIVAILHKKLSQ
ncbi:MAG: UDP-N-acetylglucosamine 2-epimerase (non-hydrolyzing) [Saprospiraceae bacterium]